MQGVTLVQPDRQNPLLPREWVHRFHRIKIQRHRDGASLVVPCTSANFYLMDLNPIWYVDQLQRHRGNALFILYLDTANSCTDRCPMCFTEETRSHEGFNQRLDVDLALNRIRQLRGRYPDTFQMISLAGPGEPLNLKRIVDLIAGCAELGPAVRVYTAGKRLEEPTIRRGLLNHTKLVRISMDAASEESYRLTHGVMGLQSRIDSIARMMEEQHQMGSDTLVGLHFVIQKHNMREIVDFAEMAKRIGVNYIVYSQETFGKVHGGFSEAEYQDVVGALETVEGMHSHSFRTVVPKLVRRQTYTEFNKDFFASPQVLNRCHNSKHRIFFGVQNDFSACWLATLDQQFRFESYIGKLSDDPTMDSVYNIIEQGVGSVLTNGANLSCNSCVADNYNGMVDKILAFLDGETDFDTKLVEHMPGQHEDLDYEFILGLAESDN